jgi:ATP/maltotriose-dependent transcriptional regulator MalT
MLVAGYIELLAGNPATAERRLGVAYEEATERDAKRYVAILGAFLARAIFESGRDAEADDIAARSLNEARNEPISRIVANCTRARLLTRRGDREQAERTARNAVDVAVRTDLFMRAEAWATLAEVLSVEGEPASATAALLRASEIYEEKGMTTAAAGARRALTS